MCDPVGEGECVPAFTCESKRGPFVPEVLKTVWTMCWKRWYDCVSCAFHGFFEDEKESGIKNRRQVWRSVQSLLPAVRAVTRVFGAFQSGVKIEGVISLLRSYSPRAYSRKKIMGVMPDIGADFKGIGEFINHLAPSHPPAHPVPISSEIRIHTRWRYSKIASQ